MTRILLLRHGATDFIKTHLAGRSPGIPLNLLGRIQAEALARRLPKPDALFTSPIERTRETAQYIADRHDLIPHICEEFSEFEFGAWTGMTFKGLNDDPLWRQFNNSRDYTSAPGGESMNDVQTRALAGLHQLVGGGYRDKTIAIVSHGDVIRSLLLHAADTPIANYWRLTVDPASISELAFEDGVERILRINDCAHLEHLTS